MSGLCCLITFCICAATLPETKFTRLSTPEETHRDANTGHDPSEQIPAENQLRSSLPLALDKQPEKQAVTRVVIERDEESAKERGDEVIVGAGTGDPIEEDDVALLPLETMSLSFWSNFREMALDRRVILATTLFTIFGFACVALDEVLAVWAATMQQFGGLGFTTDQVDFLNALLVVRCIYETDVRFD